MGSVHVSRELFDKLVREGKIVEKDVRGVNRDAIPGLSEAEVKQAEKEFQKQVIDEAEKLGWFVFHHTISKKSKKGFPDLVLFRERIVWIELKVEPNKPTADQLTFLENIERAGGECYVFYPSMWNKIRECLK